MHFFAGYFFNAVEPLVKTFPGLSFEIFGAPGVDFTPGELDIHAGLTVMEAYSIDTKIDDGLPNAGDVMAAQPGHAGNWNGFIGELAYSMAGVDDQFCTFSGVVGPSTVHPYNLAYPASLSCNLIIGTHM